MCACVCVPVCGGVFFCIVREAGPSHPHASGQTGQRWGQGRPGCQQWRQATGRRGVGAEGMALLGQAAGGALWGSLRDRYGT